MSSGDLGQRKDGLKKVWPFEVAIDVVGQTQLKHVLRSYCPHDSHLLASMLVIAKKITQLSGKKNGVRSEQRMPSLAHSVRNDIDHTSDRS
jgi:hypothetical protein